MKKKRMMLGMKMMVTVKELSEVKEREVWERSGGQPEPPLLGCGVELRGKDAVKP